MTDVLIRREEKWGKAYVTWETKTGEMEGCSYKSKNAKDCPEPLEVGRVMEGSFPRPSEGAWPCRHLDFMPDL